MEEHAFHANNGRDLSDHRTSFGVGIAPARRLVGVDAEAEAAWIMSEKYPKFIETLCATRSGTDDFGQPTFSKPFVRRRTRVESSEQEAFVLAIDAKYLEQAIEKETKTKKEI